MTTDHNNLPWVSTRDLVTIGIFAAISILIFFVIGGIAGMTLIGTIANVPIVSLFTALPYLLLASKVRKRGTFLIMGTINVLPGLMVGNLIGVALCIGGWIIAEMIASIGNYRSFTTMAIAYVTGASLQCAGFTLPIYYATSEYLNARKDMLHLTDQTLAQFETLVSWPMYGAMILLTVALSLIGALISRSLMRKHFIKAGVITN